MKHIKTSLIAGAVAVLLSACGSVGKDYQRPSLETPASLGEVKSTHGLNSKTDFLSWWQNFHDPVLDQLLKEAATNNQDLQLAVSRIAEAKASFDAGAVNHYPTVDATFSSVKNRFSQTGTRLGIPSSSTFVLYDLGVSASYEVDFWGKFTRADEASKARLLAQEANRGVALSALYSNVAQTYFALRASDARLVLAQEALKFRQDNFALQKKRYDAGSIGALDLHEADSEVVSAQIILSQATQSVHLYETALAVLLGRSATAISQPQIARGNDIDKLYQEMQLPADLPADLLNRRPDILSAEENLIAANADIGQVKAQYFPSFKLTTGVGYESRKLADLVNPSALFWNIGSNIVQPLFRAGAIGAEVKGAEARQQQALAQYTKTVQEAFRDVHDALTNSTANDEIHVATKLRVDTLKDSLRLADLRYQNGYSSYLEVLTAQRDLLSAEASLIDTKRAHLSAVVGIYHAVGGGWEKPPVFAEK